jgi:hypothetical protein
LALLNLNLLFHVIVCFLFIAFDFFGKILYWSLCPYLLNISYMHSKKAHNFKEWIN